ACRMDRLEAASDLGSERCGFAPRDRAARLDPVRERPARQELEHEVRRARELAAALDARDARVRDLGRRAALATEPLEEVGLRVAQDELDRDVAPAHRVLALVDDAHAAAAEEPDDDVVADARA